MKAYIPYFEENGGKHKSYGSIYIKDERNNENIYGGIYVSESVILPDPYLSEIIEMIHPILLDISKQPRCDAMNQPFISFNLIKQLNQKLNGYRIEIKFKDSGGRRDTSHKEFGFDISQTGEEGKPNIIIITFNDSICRKLHDNFLETIKHLKNILGHEIIHRIQKERSKGLLSPLKVNSDTDISFAKTYYGNVFEIMAHAYQCIEEIRIENLDPVQVFNQPEKYKNKRSMVVLNFYLDWFYKTGNPDLEKIWKRFVKQCIEYTN